MQNRPIIFEEILNEGLSRLIDQHYKNWTVDKAAVRFDNKTGAQFLADNLAGIFKRLVLRFYEEAEKKRKSDKSEQKGEYAVSKLMNDLVKYCNDSVEKDDFQDNYISGSQIEVLKALIPPDFFSNQTIEEFKRYRYPAAGFTGSVLFTGKDTNISLHKEIRKEILSADEIWILVSFIRLSGLNCIRSALQQAASEGRVINLLTTIYCGHTEQKAVDAISALETSAVKIHYETGPNRHHAKAWYFRRINGPDTALVGSSNLSHEAFTSGLEWNVRLSERESAEALSVIEHHMLQLWADEEFELYDHTNTNHCEKLSKALKNKQSDVDITSLGYTTICKPYPFQRDILRKLNVERNIHGCTRNLVVAATGTGKTMIAAFDYARQVNHGRYPRLLFAAHRKEILEQSLKTFRVVLNDPNFGGIWQGSDRPADLDHVFLSIPSFHSFNADQLKYCGNKHYEYVVVDEAHHGSAQSYQELFDTSYLDPKIMLGLTATPERMDGKDIKPYFNDKLAAEIRLHDAVYQGLLCPFHYYGLTDAATVDLSKINFERGTYNSEQLERVYTGNEHHASRVLQKVNEYVSNISHCRCVGFCSGVQHALYMAEYFSKHGVPAKALSGQDTQIVRNDIVNEFRDGRLSFIFVVDLFNEGVDVPEIDTILFLRPTESLTVFLQQLGRGLRKVNSNKAFESKEYLTVLDFVANAHKEYSFRPMLQALAGPQSRSIVSEVKDDFPHVPFGCNIELERKAREIILANIERSINNATQTRLIKEIQKYPYEKERPLDVIEFVKYTGIELPVLYKSKFSFTSLLQKARNGSVSEVPIAKKSKTGDALGNFIKTRLLHIDSILYLKFMVDVLQSGIENRQSEYDNVFKTWLYYDFFSQSGNKLGINSIRDALQPLCEYKLWNDELSKVVDYHINNNVSHEEDVCTGLDGSPLRVYSSYFRHHVLTTIGKSSFNKLESSREGIYRNREKKIECFFVTLNKEGPGFKESVRYEDYAVNEDIFHWQSQNSASTSTESGRRYIEQEKNGWKFLLFVRTHSKIQGIAQPFTFLGTLKYISHYGEKPVSINWKMQFPIPARFITNLAEEKAA
ncbi:MAG: DUF3427 domain-containing protein [Fibrobacteria bacterium]|nr:DUF3427 domain-containing protein [Fibrobacteria bacterium]